MSADRPLLYVVDNTVLSNYALINRPDLLRLALASGGTTTAAVRREIEMGEVLSIVPQCDWRWLPVVELTEAEQALATLLLANISIGEAECMAVAVKRSGIVVTDDRGARKQAMKYNVGMSGTLGVLKKLIDEGHLTASQADEHLAEMIAKGYYSPVTRFSQLRR